MYVQYTSDGYAGVCENISKIENFSINITKIKKNNELKHLSSWRQIKRDSECSGERYRIDKLL